MCIDQEAKKIDVGRLRIESVDNWHARWQQVLASIEQAGQRDALQIDFDGWLSARQVLLVAFAGEEVAGHICFSILPRGKSGGEVSVCAHINAVAVAPGMEELSIKPLLRRSAQERAAFLKCTEFVGFC